MNINIRIISSEFNPPPSYYYAVYLFLINNLMHLIHLYNFILVTLAKDIMPWLIAPRSNGLWSILLLQRAPSTKLLSFSFYGKGHPLPNTTLLFQIKIIMNHQRCPSWLWMKRTPEQAHNSLGTRLYLRLKLCEYTFIITSHVTQHTHQWLWSISWML